MKIIRKKSLHNQRGVSLTGYALLVGLIGVVALFALQNIGIEVSNLFSKVGNKMEQASNNDGGGGTADETTALRESSFIISSIGGPFFTAYNIDDFSLQTSPTPSPSARGDELSFTDNGNFFAKSTQVAPYMHVYETAETTADWALLPNPATLLPRDPEGLAFSHNGAILAAGYRSTGSPTHVDFTIYDTSDYSVITGPALGDRPQGVVQKIVFTNDDSRMIVAATTPSVTVFDTSDFSLSTALSPVPGTHADDISLSPDGTTLAVLQRSPNQITLYNTTSWTLSATQPSSASLGSVGQAVAWSPDGNYLAAAHVGGSHLRVWQTSDYSVVTVASPPSGTGRSIAFSADSSIMAVGYDDSPYIALYNVPSFTQIPNPSSLPTTPVYVMGFTPY